MNFLTLDQANNEPFSIQYRYRLWTATIAFSVFMSLVVGFGIAGYLAWLQRAWFGIVLCGWCALWFGLFAWMAWRVLKARWQPSNWLVRIQGNGLLIKFRSYLNHNFPSEDPVVVFLPFAEMVSASAHRIQRNIPGATRGDDTIRRTKYVELRIREDGIRLLETQLAAERTRWFVSPRKWMGRRRTQHYPVQTIGNDLIRLEWCVTPGLNQFLERISESVSVHAAAESTVDFRKAGQNQSRQETQLLELIESGDKIGAIRVARLLYKFDLTEAVRFVDGFSRQKRVEPERPKAPTESR